MSLLKATRHHLTKRLCDTLHGSSAGMEGWLAGIVGDLATGHMFMGMVEETRTQVGTLAETLPLFRT